MAKRLGKVFTMFKDNFSVDLYYKPTMQMNDIYYHLILDNTIRVKAIIKNNIFIIIDIIPISSTAYLANYYKKFIEFLMNQSFFTVLIDKTGSVSCIIDTCTKLSIPTIEDKSLISIPELVYNKLISIYNDTDYYGFFLVSVKDDEDLSNTSLSIYDDLNKYLVHSNSNNKVSIVEDSPNYSHIIYYKNNMMEIYINIDEDNKIIYVDNIVSQCSRIYYIELLELLEKFNDEVTLIIRNLTDAVIYDICKMRNYPKIKGNSMGSYILKPSNKIIINGITMKE